MSNETDTGVMFFPVEEVCFDDLLDWEEVTAKKQLKIGTVNVHKKPLFKRQDSKSGTLVSPNRTKVALFRYGTEVYAVNEKCPHAGGPLHVGDIEVLPDHSLCVRCPWHSWCYDLKTGKLQQPKGHELQAKVYPTRVTEDGRIQVGFTEFDQSYFSSGEF